MRAERLIDVERCPAGEIGSGGNTARDESSKCRGFARLIYDPAGGAASERDRRRALKHLDFLHVEWVTVVAAEIPHAVDEKVVARRETADGQIVTLGAAF